MLTEHWQEEGLVIAILPSIEPQKADHFVAEIMCNRNMRDHSTTQTELNMLEELMCVWIHENRRKCYDGLYERYESITVLLYFLWLSRRVDKIKASFMV